MVGLMTICGTIWSPACGTQGRQLSSLLGGWRTSSAGHLRYFMWGCGPSRKRHLLLCTAAECRGGSILVGFRWMTTTACGSAHTSVYPRPRYSAPPTPHLAVIPVQCRCSVSYAHVTRSTNLACCLRWPAPSLQALPLPRKTPARSK